jgi:hypothetical protein
MPLFSRHDGKLVEDVPRTRAIMPFIMETTGESVVFFEQELDLSLTLPWLKETGERLGHRLSLFPLLMLAISETLHERPRLNRFVSGQRLYQRDEVQISFAAKKSLDDDHPFSTVKRTFPQGQSISEAVTLLQGDIRAARGSELSPIDKELRIFLALPRPLLAMATRLLKWLDFHNMAPAALLADDPMYCSVFVANLGSVKLDAAYHHLYEYGNCPLFCVVGKTHQALRVVDGAPVVRDIAVLKWTLDERVEDGLYCTSSLELLRERMENPASWLAP